MKNSSNSLNGSVPSFMNAITFPSLTSIDLSNNLFNLIEENALTGFTFTCSVNNNSLPCFTAQPPNSNCSLTITNSCPLQLLYDEETLISPTDARVRRSDKTKMTDANAGYTEKICVVRPSVYLLPDYIPHVCYRRQ